MGGQWRAPNRRANCCICRPCRPLGNLFRITDWAVRLRESIDSLTSHRQSSLDDDRPFHRLLFTPGFKGLPRLSNRIAGKRGRPLSKPRIVQGDREYDQDKEAFRALSAPRRLIRGAYRCFAAQLLVGESLRFEGQQHHCRFRFHDLLRRPCKKTIAAMPMQTAATRNNLHASQRGQF